MPLVTQPKSAKHGRGTWNGDELCDLSNIRPGTTANIKEYGSSKTNGHVRRVAGLKDASGTFDMHADEVPFEVGDFGDLVLKSDADIELFNGRAVIEDVTHTVNINTGEIISVTVTYGADPIPPE